jgi:PiT family inorganic phosphate transporter
MIILLFCAVCFLAWTNGANDNFKGVASLYGSGATGYRTALLWATVTTLAGSLAAIYLAAGLLGKFSGKGLVPDALAGSIPFVLTVALAAGLTVLLATRTGFPISTTHALTGAMVGGGWMAVGNEVDVAVLRKSFVLPLLLSPLVAVFLGSSLYLFFRWMRLRLGITKEWCLCMAGETHRVPVPQPASVLAIRTATPALPLSLDSLEACTQRYAGEIRGISGQRVMDLFHFLSAGVVCFARGLNDTPKMAALLLILPGIQTPWALAAVAVAIAIGGWLGAAKVAEMISHGITGMNHGQGFAANLGTGILVIAASVFGLPVSTTHVSVGALFGMGLLNGEAKAATIRKILLSWVVTLPCAALLAMLCWCLISLMA